MNRFFDVLLMPIIKASGVKSVIEVGAQSGLNTVKLLNYFKFKEDGKVTSIDPVPGFDFKDLEIKNNGKYKMYTDISINILRDIDCFEAVILDGDHNYYTVKRELDIIKDKSSGGNPLIILHDTSYPYDYRDLYYNIEDIPTDKINKYKKLGINPFSNELEEGGINNGCFHSISYGIEECGVLKAVEDFIIQNVEYEFNCVECLNGFGVIKKKGSYSEVTELMNNPLILKRLLKETEKYRIEELYFRGKQVFEHENKIEKRRMKKIIDIILNK